MKFYYVYILRSIASNEHYYVGLTENLEERLNKHNTGQCRYTSEFIPWRIETAIAFRSKEKAVAFEKYLKSHSGRVFAKKHF
jgi:putative endonuclease